MYKVLRKLAVLTAFTFIIWCSITLLVHNLAYIVSYVADSVQLYNIFSQLSNASVSVPLWIPIIFGGMICCIPWKREWCLKLIITGIAAALIIVLLSLYFTKVNTVPLGAAFKIIINLLSGGIEGI